VTGESLTDSAFACLTQIHGRLLQATLKQLASKSVATRQQCFELLRQTDEAQNGGLEGEADAICSAAATAVRSVDSSASSSLAMSALAFLATFFRHHSGRIYASHLNTLVPAIVRCMKDKLQRVNFEAFSAATALAQSLRPQGSASPLALNYSKPVQDLFTATTEVLGDTSVDGEVRERALDTLGHLLVHEGDALSKDYGTAFSLISTRLASEATAVTAVQVIGRIAASPLCKGKQFESWLLEVLPEVVTALRKTRRTASKNAEFSCLQSVLTRVGRNLPANTAEALVIELKQFIDAPMTLSTISLILALQPSSFGTIEQQILPETFQLLQSTDHIATVIDSLVSFYGFYTAANPSSAAALVSTCIDNIKPTTAGAKLPDATTGGTITYTSTARCVGVIAEQSQGGLDGILSGFQKIVKVRCSNGRGQSKLIIRARILARLSCSSRFRVSAKSDVACERP
jgi:cullin-associated NEDD8-dissociated protein 1